uniref:zinc finger protein 664-like n=1 Tax=Ictidomys tridecemlineatus TaxID=43179 RepID=UPI00038BE308|nr:zinc finger protein 664-like [Ictidomys tridecemlineatus]
MANVNAVMTEKREHTGKYEKICINDDTGMVFADGCNLSKLEGGSVGQESHEHKESWEVPNQGSDPPNTQRCPFTQNHDKWEKCAKIINEWPKALTHPNVQRKDRSFECKKYGELFNQFSVCTEHEKINTMEMSNTYTGEKYRESPDESPNQIGPNTICTQEDPWRITECDESLPPSLSLEQQQNMQNEEKLHEIEDCKTFFSSSSHQGMHKSIDGGEKTYNCKECGKTYISSSELLCHQRMHTGGKHYNSEESGKAYMFSTQLVPPQLLHTGEKPYKCKHCAKTFKCTSSLCIHQRIHTGEKPHKCNECGKPFISSSHLNVHKRTHTGEKSYKCECCGKAFAHSSSLAVHQRIHTGEKPYKSSCFQWRLNQYLSCELQSFELQLEILHGDYEE